MGWWVPGWSGGSPRHGRSAAMLYQARGIRSSDRTNLVRRGRTAAIGSRPPGERRGEREPSACADGPATGCRGHPPRGTRRTASWRGGPPPRWLLNRTTSPPTNDVRQPAAAARSASATAIAVGTRRGVQPGHGEVRAVGPIVGGPAQRDDARVDRRRRAPRARARRGRSRATASAVAGRRGRRRRPRARPRTGRRRRRPRRSASATSVTRSGAVGPRKRTVRWRFGTWTQRGTLPRGPAAHLVDEGRAGRDRVRPAAGRRRTAAPRPQAPCSRPNRSRSSRSTRSASSWSRQPTTSTALFSSSL